MKENEFLDVEIAWDEYSESVGTDIDELQEVAGKVIMTRSQFVAAVCNLAGIKNLNRK